MRKEPKSVLKIRRLNSVIANNIIGDTFTLDELLDAHKQRYPRCTPTKQGLAHIINWPRVNAIRENGVYKKKNNGGL